MTLGDGTVVTQTQVMAYNAGNEQVAATVAGPGGSSPQTTTTTYDLDGNTIQVEQPANNVTYDTYSFADQLVYSEIDAAPVNGPTHQTQESLGYDAAGNQTDLSDFDHRHTATSYDGDNRIVQSVATTGTATLTTTNGYDPNGNTLTQTVQTVDTSAPTLSQTHTYTAAYNADDWTTSSGDDGLVLSYGYDAKGQQRTQTQNDPTTISTVLDAEGRATAIGESANGTGPYSATIPRRGPARSPIKTPPTAARRGRSSTRSARSTTGWGCAPATPWS